MSSDLSVITPARIGQRALVTKYAGATGRRGSRIIVRTEELRPLVFSWCHALDIQDNHRRAAEVATELWGFGKVRKVALTGGHIKAGSWAWIIHPAELDQEDAQ